MDIKRIVLGFFAAAAVLVGCEPKEEDFGVPQIELNPVSLDFAESSSSQTVTLFATRDWTVSSKPEWIAVDPSSGTASLKEQTVTITVISNEGYNRDADITFSIGLMKEYVKVSQSGQKGQYDSGNGTKERPYSASAAYDYIISLPADTESGPFYIKGIISKMVASSGVEQYFANNSYGNASFFISDDGSTTSPQFEVFQTYYLGNRKWKTGDDDVKVGDEVIIYGPVVYYKGNTPETVGKGASYIYSLNGKTEAENPPQTEITASTVADFIAKADESTYYRLTGTVSAFKTGTNSSGKNWMQFNLTDNTGSILVYGFNDGEYDKWANTIKDGGAVVLTGTYQYYKDKQQHEVMNVTVESFEAGQTPGPGDDASGSGTLADPYNAAGVIAYIKSIGDKESTENIYVKGKISAIKYPFSVEYGTAQFDISDDGSTSSTQFKAYSALYLGNRKWAEGDTQIKVGDDVILCGKVTNYNGTYETSSQKAFIYSLNGKTDGGDTPQPPAGETDHGATTVANFLAASESTTDWYELTGTISNLKEGDKFGNFDLTDNSGSVYVYGVLSTKGGEKQKFQELVSQYGIANGGTITIKANRGSYQGKDEAVNAYFVSYNGQGGQGGDETTPTDIASIIAAADDSSVAAENVFVGAITTKGYVATDGKKSIYVYGNAAPTVAVGDIVKFSGTKTTYYGLPEITSPKTTKTSAGTVAYPDPVDITASFDTYTATEAVYVKYKAKMFKSGNYTNFKVEGAELTGSLSSAPSAYYNGINEGDEVIIYGYYNGINTNNKLLNVIAVKIENLTTGETIPSEGGQETKGISLTFPDENKESNGVSAYNKSWSAKIGSMTWTVDGFNNNSWKNDWTYIKCGSKSFESVATISTDKAIDYKVIKVLVTIDKCTTDKIKSTKLLVARDSEFKDVIETVSQNISSGDMTYNVSSPAAGLFYRLVYDCEQGSANGLIQLSKVVYSE